MVMVFTDYKEIDSDGDGIPDALLKMMVVIQQYRVRQLTLMEMDFQIIEIQMLMDDGISRCNRRCSGCTGTGILYANQF